MAALLEASLLRGSFCQVGVFAVTCLGGRRVQSKRLVSKRRANTVTALGTQLFPATGQRGMTTDLQVRSDPPVLGTQVASWGKE